MRKDSCFTPDDGYTEQGYIEAKPGLHGEFRFEYRPMLVEQRSRILRTMSEMKDEEQDVVIAKTMAERLVSWDNPKPIAVERTRRIQPVVFYQVWAIILGTSPSAMDPRWDDERKVEGVENLMEASTADVPVGVAQEVTAEKNSDAG